MYKKPSHTNSSYEKPSHKINRTLAIRMKNHYANNFYKNHQILTVRMKNHDINIMRINIFITINQINKHKAKIYNHYTYTQIIIKKIRNYLKKFTDVIKKMSLLTHYPHCIINLSTGLD